MQKEFTEDQYQFRDLVSRFLRDKSSAVSVRKLMASAQGYDTDVWRQLCEELGLAGTHIPEKYGGFGFGAIELGIVMEEMGRHLYCGPFFSSSVMAGYALLNCATEKHKEDLLPGIATGATITTLVLDNLNHPDLVGESIRAIPQDSTFILSGTADIVLDAQITDLFLVMASTSTGLALFLILRDTHGVNVSPLEALDPTRKLSQVTFDKVPAINIGEVNRSQLTRMWEQICTALAHEMMGGAQHLLDSTIEYTKLRFQFGRPIGSFQALKHRCADLLMDLELAKAATHYAAACDDAREGEPYVADMAKAMAADVYINVARAAIQLRGGIGFTWEDDTHLWFKRAKSSEVFLGTPQVHRERMMHMIEAQS